MTTITFLSKEEERRRKKKKGEREKEREEEEVAFYLLKNEHKDTSAMFARRCFDIHHI